MKRCTQCGIEYPESNIYFSKNSRSKSGLSSKCKQCDKKYREENKDRISKYREENAEHLRELNKKWRNNNREKINEYKRAYRKKHLNESRIKEQAIRDSGKYKDVQRKCSKEYYINNKELVKNRTKEYKLKRVEEERKYQREWARKNRETIEGRIISSLRCRTLRAYGGKSKDKKTKELIGCDFQTFKKHIEVQFRDGMSWDNYGIKGWHFDHIKPISSFDLTDEKQALECFNYKNIQPLWWWENLSKGDKTMDEWMNEREVKEIELC